MYPVQQCTQESRETRVTTKDLKDLKKQTKITWFIQKCVFISLLLFTFDFSSIYWNITLFMCRERCNFSRNVATGKFFQSVWVEINRSISESLLTTLPLLSRDWDLQMIRGPTSPDATSRMGSTILWYKRVRHRGSASVGPSSAVSFQRYIIISPGGTAKERRSTCLSSTHKERKIC